MPNPTSTLQPSAPRSPRAILAIVLAVVVVAAGAVLLFAQMREDGDKSTNGFANTQQTNSNINSVLVTANTNSSGSNTTLYSGQGFNLRYPTNWAAHQIVAGSTGLVPKGYTYYFEGAVEYPVVIAANQKSAEEYLSATDASRKIVVTINGGVGFRVLAFNGLDYFYIFTLKQGGSVLIISRIHQLEPEQRQAPSQQELLAAFDQIVNSLNMD